MTGEQSTRSMGSMGGQGKHRVHALESSLEPGPVQIQQEDVIIAVMGVTGCGKTTFVNQFSQYPLKIGHGLDSSHLPGTQNVEVVPCNLPNGQRFFLADTPGFDDSFKTDTEILRLVAAWLSAAHKSHVKLTGIIYLHRIPDVRVGGTGVKNIKMFRRLCGDDGLKSVCLATTMWETIKKEDGEKREKQLQESATLWKSMIEQGSKVFRHDAGRESGLHIIQYLMDRKRPVTLDIQREMVDKGLRLDQTSAGAEVASEVEKAKQHYEKRLKDLEKDLHEALSKQDHERREMIEETKAEFQAKISSGQHQMKKLQADSEQLYEEMRQKHEKEIAEMTVMMKEKESAIRESQMELSMMKQGHEQALEIQKLQLRMEWKERYYKMMYSQIGCIVM